jgi:hypothetical protein
VNEEALAHWGAVAPNKKLRLKKREKMWNLSLYNILHFLVSFSASKKIFPASPLYTHTHTHTHTEI